MLLVKMISYSPVGEMSWSGLQEVGENLILSVQLLGYAGVLELVLLVGGMVCAGGASWSGMLLATLLFKLSPLLWEVLPTMFEAETMRVTSSEGTFLFL
jgi:hypothetical protein